MAERAGAAICSCVAEERNRVLVQNLSGTEENLQKDLAGGAKVKEAYARKQFKASESFDEQYASKALVRTRRMITPGDGGWREVRKDASGGGRPPRP